MKLTGDLRPTGIGKYRRSNATNLWGCLGFLVPLVVLWIFVLSVIMALVVTFSLGCSRYDSDKENDPNCHWNHERGSYWCEEDSDDE
jgi:hypothetical protein